MKPWKPWMNEQAIMKYEGLLFEGVRVLELGAGKSTLWLEERGAIVESYEHDYQWFTELSGLLKTDNVNLYYESDYVSRIADYSPDTFDIVVVDGIDRLSCMEEILLTDVVKPNGWVLFDDSERRFLHGCEDYARACELYTHWECSHVADNPAKTVDEYFAYRKTGYNPMALKQTMFAQRNDVND